MDTSHRAQSKQIKMKTLLVCSVLVAVSSAQYLGYPYGLGSPLTYTPHVIKPVIKEVEVPVEYNTYAVKETGCTNVFGFAVPCLTEGEARRKRSADEAAEVPAPVLAYSGLPLRWLPLRSLPLRWLSRRHRGRAQGDRGGGPPNRLQAGGEEDRAGSSLPQRQRLCCALRLNVIRPRNNQKYK